MTSFQPLYGKLSDIFGRKEALLSAYAFFGLGCLLCGLSTRIEYLIAARVTFLKMQTLTLIFQTSADFPRPVKDLEEV